MVGAIIEDVDVMAMKGHGGVGGGGGGNDKIKMLITARKRITMI